MGRDQPPPWRLALYGAAISALAGVAAAVVQFLLEVNHVQLAAAF